MLEDLPTSALGLRAQPLVGSHGDGRSDRGKERQVGEVITVEAAVLERDAAIPGEGAGALELALAIEDTAHDLAGVVCALELELRGEQVGMASARAVGAAK